MIDKICGESGKVCYSKREAGSVVNAFKSRKHFRHCKKGRKGDNVPQRIYFCKYCGTYHVTHIKYIKDRKRYFNGYRGEEDGKRI